MEHFKNPTVDFVNADLNFLKIPSLYKSEKAVHRYYFDTKNPKNEKKRREKDWNKLMFLINITIYAKAI